MNNILKNILLSGLLLLLCTSVNAADFIITSYGAKKGAKTPCTTAIQQAIDVCHKAGGGRVVVPKGKFVTGAIVLKSGVTLHLEQGAKLLGSTNPAHYVLSKGRPGVYVTSQLIFAANAQNIGISGTGTIDGQGKVFTDASCNAHGITRPMLIRFDACKGVNVSDVTMRNSGVWMQQYYACENVVIKDIKVYNHCNNCNDGLDINGCRNVTVSGAVVDADDDGICLKNVTLQPCSNVKITNCTVSSHCNALKIGTETLGDFDNITFSHCTVKPSKQKTVHNGRANGISAVSIESVDGSRITNVTVSDITVNGTETPIFVRLGNRGNTYGQKLSTPRRGAINGVVIENITITKAGSTGCSISGLPGQEVENVKLRNISIANDGGMPKVEAPKDDKAKAYPEGTMWGTLPASGFFIKNAKNVDHSEVNVTTRRADARPAILRMNVK
jgi:polygalacturonase